MSMLVASSVHGVCFAVVVEMYCVISSCHLLCCRPVFRLVLFVLCGGVHWSACFVHRLLSCCNVLAAHCHLCFLCCVTQSSMLYCLMRASAA